MLKHFKDKKINQKDLSCKTQQDYNFRQVQYSCTLEIDCRDLVLSFEILEGIFLKLCIQNN